MRLRTTRLIQPLFPSIQWRGADTSIYLTFDDGPHPVSTPAVLSELSKRNMKASFFLIGRNVLQYPQLVSEINSEGHTIGNHTFDHILMLFRTTEEVHNQIARTSMAIAEITNRKTGLFRPPFGYFGPAAYRSSRETGHRMVLWDVDTVDHQNGDPRSVSERAATRTRPGSIVLFHDNEATKATAGEVLSRYLDTVQSREYITAPLAE